MTGSSSPGSRRTGLDVDERLRPRLRSDLDILLKTRHGLDLEHPEHGPRIEAIIGAEAWDLIRVESSAETCLGRNSPPRAGNDSHRLSRGRQRTRSQD